MLATRIIPTLLCRGRQLVKGQQFNSWRSVGTVPQAVQIHQMRGVDELILLDIAATPEGRGPDLKLIEELTAKCFMPLTVGGGVRSVQDVRDLLNAGADKVAIGIQALLKPWVVEEIASHVGRQAVVVALDIGPDEMPWHGWTPSVMGKAETVAIYMEAMGAGEILLTSIEREGTMKGYDLDLIRQVSEAVSIPVIAHGGCGTYEHMYQAIQAGANAVASGAMFQFTDQTPRGAAQYLAGKGVEVRL